MGNPINMVLNGIYPFFTPPDFYSTNWGDIVTLVGTILTILGLIWTIISTNKAKESAESAKEAAIEARKEIKKRDTSDHLVQAVALIEEIKGFQRNRIWISTPEKYSNLRKLLIEIRDTYPNISEEQRTELIATISQITRAEVNVEKYLEDTRNEISFSKFNSVLSQQIEILIELLNQIRNS
jgi:hypothetical protein